LSPQETTGRTSRQAALEVAALLAVAAVYIWTRWQLLDVPLDRDEGAFGVVGQAILRGELPYRDVLDHKPPGVFYLYALALEVFPATARGVHQFLLVWNAATLVFVALVARRVGGRICGYAAAWFYAWLGVSPSVHGFAATSENLMLLPMMLSIYLALGGTGAGRRTVALVVSGALGAAACWIKQPAAIALFVVPLWLLASHGRAGRSRALRELGLWISGGITTSVAIVLPFILAGVGFEFFYWSFTHSLLYAGVSGVPVGELIRARAFDLLPDLGVPLALALLAGLGLRRVGHPHGWFASLFLALSLLACAHSPRLYGHYFSQLVPALSVAAGLGIGVLDGFRRRLWIGAAWLPLAIALLAPLVMVSARPWYWIRPDPVRVSVERLGPQGFSAAPEIASYLVERTDRDASIFVYGSEPQIAFLAQRRLATPFVMLYPLNGPWARASEFQARAWTALETTPPEYLIIVRNPRSLLRLPDTDPFFSERIQRLSDRAYRTEALVIREDAGSLRLIPVHETMDLAAMRPRTLFVVQRLDERARVP
jgi:hypothetical protein